MQIPFEELSFFRSVEYGGRKRGLRCQKEYGLRGVFRDNQFVALGITVNCANIKRCYWSNSKLPV